MALLLTHFFRVAGDFELREDGFFELREDGSFELRDG